MASVPVSTFSIVAYDASTRSWGVAVASRFLASGSIVPWAKAGVGAVATQAFANPRFGPLGLAMLEQGLTAEEAVASLVAGDPGRQVRQLAVVDAAGGAAAFTGDECTPWAGQLVGQHFSCQGNILADEGVLRAMADAWGRGSEPMPERLVAALTSGQAAGGDRRGRQSAAVLVVKDGAGMLGYSDRQIDLRVDDHPAPIEELARILALHRETFGA